MHIHVQSQYRTQYAPLSPLSCQYYIVRLRVADTHINFSWTPLELPLPSQWRTRGTRARIQYYAQSVSQEKACTHRNERSNQHLGRLVHHYAPPCTALLYCSLASTSTHPTDSQRKACTHRNERSNQHLDRLGHYVAPPRTALLYCSLAST